MVSTVMPCVFASDCARVCNACSNQRHDTCTHDTTHTCMQCCSTAGERKHVRYFMHIMQPRAPQVLARADICVHICSFWTPCLYILSILHWFCNEYGSCNFRATSASRALIIGIALQTYKLSKIANDGDAGPLGAFGRTGLVQTIPIKLMYT